MALKPDYVWETLADRGSLQVTLLCHLVEFRPYGTAALVAVCNTEAICSCPDGFAWRSSGAQEALTLGALSRRRPIRADLVQ